MLRKNNILEIVLVFIVCSNGKKIDHTKTDLTKTTTANIVENIRRQLMENNYDYAQSQEKQTTNASGKIIARANYGQQEQANWPANRVVPTMRIKKQHRPPPSTYTFSFTKKTPMQRKPKEPRYVETDALDDGRPYAAVRFEQGQLYSDDAHRANLFGAQKKYSQIPELFYEAKLKQQLRSDEFLPKINPKYTYRQPASTNRIRTTKRPQKVIRRQPYPKIDVQYNPPNNDQPQAYSFDYNQRPSTVRPQRFKVKKSTGPTSAIMYMHNNMHGQPPNIRVKYTIPQLTSSKKPPNMHQQKPKLVRRKVKSTKPTTPFTKKPRRLEHNSKVSSIPDSMWEEDGGPYEDYLQMHHNPENGADLPLAKKYHFRAVEVTNLPDPQVKIANSTIKISVMRLKRKHGGRRSGTYRKIIKEESDRGIALMVLDGEPLPEFKLPAECRQYMEGSPEHDNLHELA